MTLEALNKFGIVLAGKNWRAASKKRSGHAH